MIELVYIPEDMIDGSWKHVEKDVADALARSNGYALASNIKQWVKDKNIRIMTGHHREKWQHLIKNIEKFAWDNKCDSMELIARPGWQKVLSRFGYNRTHVLLEKNNKEKK